MRVFLRAAMVAAGICSLSVLDLAAAAEFKTDLFEGSFNSTITMGGARRMRDPSCSIVGDPGYCASANVDQWSAGDDGDLNYRKGDWFSLYVKGTHELLLKTASGLKFFARGTWKEDPKAGDTRRTDLSDDARQQIVHNATLLDLWVSQDFHFGGQNGRVRLGQQVISWGEALFLTGGVANNVFDVQKLLVPGTQMKEGFLPVPALSVSSSLGDTLSGEAYYQFRWRRSLVPPVGSYFSSSNIYDRGRTALAYSGANPNLFATDANATLGLRQVSMDDAVLAIYNAGNYGIPILGDQTPRNRGEWGLSLKWAPAGTQINTGFYAVNYHDQLPVLQNASGYNATLGADVPALRWMFPENRRMYGFTTNFPVGNWAIGTELSYRPRDAVTLSSCYGANGPLDAATNAAAINPVDCPLYRDNKKYQASVTALLQLQKSDQPLILNALGADSAFLSVEAAVTKYPGLHSIMTRVVDGIEVQQALAAAYLPALDRSNPAFPVLAPIGTSTSWGYVVDFNWTYDGRPLAGWQLTPGFTFSHSVKGDTPNIGGQFLDGNKSLNLYLQLNQNPTKWQFGLNYTLYFGGKNDVVVRQYFKDRDFLGMFASYNF